MVCALSWVMQTHNDLLRTETQFAFSAWVLGDVVSQAFLEM